jgi:actin-related protein 6
MSHNPVVILDNGAGFIKVGYATDPKPQVMPNAIMRNKNGRRSYIGDEIDGCNNLADLYYRRPAEKV